MSKFYAADLARIHNERFADFCRDAGAQILELMRRAGHTEGRVVDLGCGGGQWAKRLTNAGYDVTGIDVSPDMIRIARRTAPQASFVVGSALDATVPPARVITALGEVINYLPKPSDPRRLFRCVHASLEKNGLFIFDASPPGRGKPPYDLPIAMTEPDFAMIVRFVESEHRRTLTREITAFVRRKDGYVRDHETHRIHLYPPPAKSRGGYATRVSQFGFGKATGAIASRRRSTPSSPGVNDRVCGAGVAAGGRRSRSDYPPRAGWHRGRGDR